MTKGSAHGDKQIPVAHSKQKGLAPGAGVTESVPGVSASPKGVHGKTEQNPEEARGKAAQPVNSLDDAGTGRKSGTEETVREVPGTKARLTPEAQAHLREAQKGVKIPVRNAGIPPKEKAKDRQTWIDGYESGYGNGFRDADGQWVAATRKQQEAATNTAPPKPTRQDSWPTWSIIVIGLAVGFIFGVLI